MSYNKFRIFMDFASNKYHQPFLIFYRSCSKSSETNGKAKDSSDNRSYISSIVPNEQQKQGRESGDENASTVPGRGSSKYSILACLVGFGGLGGYLIHELGKPPVDSNGNPMNDEYSYLPLYKQYFYRTLNEMEYYKRMISEPSREKLLPDPLQPPYYQPPYTLVLELTDVLVHPDYTYQTGWRFKKRPGIDHFLESLGSMFEIVIFTAEQGMTVFPIIEALDPNNIISYKLVRDATHYVDGHHVKDLTKLNRDPKKVIVIDWNSESVKFHTENLFPMKRWMGNDDDSSLIDLAAFLRTIAQSEVDDVREVLRYYSQFSEPLSVFRDKQRQLMEQQEASRLKQQNKTPPVVKRWAPTLLQKN